jgi:hypothetical protein
LNLLGVIFAFFLCYLFLIWRAGKIFPILQLFLFVYFIQYVVSVFLIYTEYPILRKQMPISEDRLFGFLLPALVSMFAGVFIFNKDIDVSEKLHFIDPKMASRLGRFLFLFSYTLDILEMVGLPIGSIISFTFNLKMIGAMCCLFKISPLNIVIIVMAISTMAQNALSEGIFIDFFVWVTYFFFFYCLRFKLAFKFRIMFVFIAAPLLFIVQSVKHEYRQATWSGKSSGGIGLFSELAEKKQSKQDGALAQSEGMIRTVGRLNQGWHLGMVLKRVPSRQPFVNGDELKSDLIGVFLPRVIVEDKKVTGGHDKFTRFTGHPLENNTSMTIGVLGDFYINYGTTGSYIGLFIFGAIIALSLRFFINRHVLGDPINVVWIPFLFNYLIRANNDFYTVTNGLVKGYIVFLGVNYLRKKFFMDKNLYKSY